MKKPMRWLLFCGIIFGLTACNLPAGLDTGASGQNTAQPYQTVSALLTRTIQAQETDSFFEATETTPPASATPLERTSAASTTPALTSGGLTPAGSTVAAPSPAPTLACDLAQPGRPIDVTIPDDSTFHPGAYFSKTWRLVNAGTCTWEQTYSVLWFSGDNLGMTHHLPLGQRVAPGKSIDITVDMLAPQEPGAYQSNWKISNTQGKLFGIGSNGDAPFWVRILVVPADTATPAPTATAVPPTATAVPASAVPATASPVDHTATPEPTQTPTALVHGSRPSLALSWQVP